MQIILEGSTKEIAAQIAELHAIINVDAAQLPLPIGDAAPKTRKKKETATEAAAPALAVVTETPPVVEAAPAAPAAPTSLSIEDVRTAVAKVLETKGMDAVAEVFGKFNSAKGVPCKRGPELQTTDYAAFIKTCAEKVAS